jgi:AraC-like DNA-binding protein
MLEVIGPKNDFLKKWIDYIFRYTSDYSNFERRLIIFPNIGAAVTFYFDCEFYEVSSQQFISEEKKGSNGVVLHINRFEPIEIIERGRQERLTVVFKAFGINHFIPTSLQEISRNQNPSAISIISKDKRYDHLQQVLNSFRSVVQRMEAIEDFLVSIYRDPGDPLLEEIITEFDPDEKLTTIATKKATTTKTIDRLFKKHIGLTPVAVKQILKFRNSLRAKLSGKNQTLEHVAFDTNYHDLPYMMKAYRKFTGQTAKTFFDRLSISENGKYLYQEIY